MIITTSKVQESLKTISIFKLKQTNIVPSILKILTTVQLYISSKIPTLRPYQHGQRRKTGGEEKKRFLIEQFSKIKKQSKLFFGFCQDLQYLHSWKCNTYPDQKASVIHTFFFSGLVAIVCPTGPKKHRKNTKYCSRFTTRSVLLAFLSPMDRQQIIMSLSTHPSVDSIAWL